MASSSRSQRTAGTEGEMTKSNMKLNKSLTTSAKRWVATAVLCSFSRFTNSCCLVLVQFYYISFSCIFRMSLVFFAWSVRVAFRVARCPVFNQTAGILALSSIKMIIIPDNACANSSIFWATDTGNVSVRYLRESQLATLVALIVITKPCFTQGCFKQVSLP